ncbi:MAG: cell division protein ZapE, partial [Alphaproteobacteria bacterium]
PLGEDADAAMAARWAELAGGAPERLELRLGSRRVCLPAYRNGVGRASFAELCEAPLGPAEYLLLADRLRTLMIDRIPVLSRARYDAAKRFMTLIDALYEARRQLIASAEAAPDRLYVEGANAFEFHRTASRLVEMQSEGWAEAG